MRYRSGLWYYQGHAYTTLYEALVEAWKEVRP